MTEESNEIAASEQLLAKAIGGWRGLLDSSLPTVVFLALWTAAGHNLQMAAAAAVATAVVLAGWRISQRRSTQQVLSGLIGVAVAGYVATRTGNAEDFFLPGILINIAYGTVIALSILVRHPLIGYVIGGLTGDLTAWRKDRARLRKYSLISWWWVGMFALRLAVQLPLYYAGSVDTLGLVKLIMGWPLYLAVVYVTYRAVVMQNGGTPGPRLEKS